MCDDDVQGDKWDGHAAPTGADLITLMDVEQGYQNVRVSQGKPLNSGNRAKLLFRPEPCRSSPTEQPEKEKKVREEQEAHDSSDCTVCDGQPPSDHPASG